MIILTLCCVSTGRHSSEVWCIIMRINLIAEWYSLLASHPITLCRRWSRGLHRSYSPYITFFVLCTDTVCIYVIPKINSAEDANETPTWLSQVREYFYSFCDKEDKAELFVKSDDCTLNSGNQLNHAIKLRKLILLFQKSHKKFKYSYMINNFVLQADSWWIRSSRAPYGSLLE